jgi:hypothetical protein
VAAQPRGLEEVLITDFWLLTGFAIIGFFTGFVIEGTPLGAALSRAIDRVTSGLRDNTELLFRVFGGFFFVALWTVGDFILTPELKTTSPAIAWLQLAIAAGLVSRRTMPLSALGIVALFAVAVARYGVFHLADYPIFLGFAAYLALRGLHLDLFGIRPIDVVRWCAAITLMWASVEKWAYPQWSFPLLIEYPALSFGYEPEYYMRAAGVVEFTLALALTWTPLVRRCAAIVLIAMFTSAAVQFGKLDVIGHALIVVVWNPRGRCRAGPRHEVATLSAGSDLLRNGADAFPGNLLRCARRAVRDQDSLIAGACVDRSVFGSDASTTGQRLRGGTRADELKRSGIIRKWFCGTNRKRRFSAYGEN